MSYLGVNYFRDITSIYDCMIITYLVICALFASYVVGVIPENLHYDYLQMLGICTGDLLPQYWCAGWDMVVYDANKYQVLINGVVNLGLVALGSLCLFLNGGRAMLYMVLWAHPWFTARMHCSMGFARARHVVANFDIKRVNETRWHQLWVAASVMLIASGVYGMAIVGWGNGHSPDAWIFHMGFWAVCFNVLNIVCVLRYGRPLVKFTSRVVVRSRKTIIHPIVPMMDIQRVECELGLQSKFSTHIYRGC